MREDEYKPQLLHPEDVKIDMDKTGNRTARSETSLVPEENKSNPIRSLKERVSPVNINIHSRSTQASNMVVYDDVLNNEEIDNLVNPILYVRGVPSESFYLILAGKVMICSGNEGFLVEQGAFNYMGVDCLTNNNYIPDFSAKVIGKAKLLKITREEYKKALSLMAVTS